jgi:hypothetical protein
VRLLDPLNGTVYHNSDFDIHFEHICSTVFSG